MDWKQELLKRLDALADKLGTTSAYLWHVLIKQAVADGVFYFFITLCLVVTVIVGVHYAKRLHVYNDKESWDNDGAAFAEVAIIVVTVLAFMFIFVSAYSGFMGMFNPEYQALHEVLQTLGK